MCITSKKKTFQYIYIIILKKTNLLFAIIILKVFLHTNNLLFLNLHKKINFPKANGNKHRMHQVSIFLTLSPSHIKYLKI